MYNLLKTRVMEEITTIIILCVFVLGLATFSYAQMDLETTYKFGAEFFRKKLYLSLVREVVGGTVDYASSSMKV